MGSARQPGLCLSDVVVGNEVVWAGTEKNSKSDIANGYFVSFPSKLWNVSLMTYYSQAGMAKQFNTYTTTSIPASPNALT